MWKVSISNQSQNLAWEAKFDSQELAQAWLSSQVGKPHRLPEREVPIQDSYAQEDVLEVIQSEVQGILQDTHVRLRAQFSSSITDISAELASEQAKLDAQKFLDESDWKVLRHRDQLDAGIATSLTNEQYLALLSERQAKRNLI